MINEKTTIAEIIKTKKGAEILAKYGVPCLTCPMASQEIKFLQIGDVADMYGLEKEKMIEELNKK